MIGHFYLYQWKYNWCTFFGAHLLNVVIFLPAGTGNGKKDSLKNKSGGHCTQYHMKLHIYVCDPKKG